MVLEQGLNGDQIVIYDNGSQLPLIWTHLIPATVEGKALHNVENAMFTAAMAYALGLSLDQIRNGLRTFDNTFFQSPGRMNIFDEHGFRVILDYGHNEAAVGAMVDLVERLQPLGKRIVCVTAPGDRRDEDIRDIAAKVAGHFDTYLCHADDNPRGRAPDEVPELMQAALIELGVPEDAIEIAESETASVQTALEMARPNDLVLIFCDGDHPHLEADHLLPPQGGAEAGAARAAGRRLRLRRAGGLPHPQRRARRPHRARRTDAQRMAEPVGPPARGSSSPSSAAGWRTTTSPSSPRCTASSGGRILVFPTASSEPEAVGEETPAGVPRRTASTPRWCRSPRQRPRASPTTRRSRPRRRLRQRLFHRRRPGQDRRARWRPKRRRDRRSSPRSAPPRPPAAWSPAPAPAPR